MGCSRTCSGQASWAGVRDRLLAGEVEAAHALASLVYAIDLGIAGPQCPMALLMTLNHNGQAITLAPALAHALAAGRTLPQALAGLGRRAVFAQTFPTWTHALWLYYWLAAGGVDPMRDVDVLSIPPPQMPEALGSGLERLTKRLSSPPGGRGLCSESACTTLHCGSEHAVRAHLTAARDVLFAALSRCVLLRRAVGGGGRSARERQARDPQRSVVARSSGKSTGMPTRIR